MAQDDINRSEWMTPENWASGVYISEKDSRYFVPKRSRDGTTLNFGHSHYRKLSIPILWILWHVGVITLE
jgi:uncharacterized membrane protein